MVPTPTDGWAPSTVTSPEDRLPLTAMDLDAWLWRINQAMPVRPVEHDDSDPVRCVMSEIVGHGAYLCLDFSNGRAGTAAATPIQALVDRLGLRNEFDPGPAPPRESVAFLQRVSAVPGVIRDDAVLEASAIVHVASQAPEPVEAFCTATTRLLDGVARVRILRGVVRPKQYTGGAMHEFAYAHAVVQAPGNRMPHAFLVPMSKTPGWWAKGWMERHTYFLPRYDDDGRMSSRGHALAAEAGIACLLRRTYRNTVEPAPEGEYDFVTYFECADVDVPTFHRVCANLRDVTLNPEWTFVREGPTWHGRRVPTWADLFR